MALTTKQRLDWPPRCCRPSPAKPISSECSTCGLVVRSMRSRAKARRGNLSSKSSKARKPRVDARSRQRRDRRQPRERAPPRVLRHELDRARHAQAERARNHHPQRRRIPRRGSLDRSPDPDVAAHLPYRSRDTGRRWVRHRVPARPPGCRDHELSRAAPAIAKQLGTPDRREARGTRQGQTSIRLSQAAGRIAEQRQGLRAASELAPRLEPGEQGRYIGTGTAAADELDYALGTARRARGRRSGSAVGRRLGAAQVGRSASRGVALAEGAARDPPASRGRSLEAGAREQCRRQRHADARAVSDQHRSAARRDRRASRRSGNLPHSITAATRNTGPRWSDESGHPVRRHSRADEDPTERTHHL